MPTKPLTRDGKPIVTPSTIEPGDTVTLGGDWSGTALDVERWPGANGGHHAVVTFDKPLWAGATSMTLKPGHYLELVDQKTEARP